MAAGLVAISVAVMACTDAFTVNSIVENPDEPGPPHNLYGLGVNSKDADPEGYLVLRIGPVANPDRPCEMAEVRVWEEPATRGDAQLPAGRACLTEVAGNTVVGISTLTQPLLHLRYLVRLDRAELYTCQLLTVWGLAWDLSGNEASEAQLDGLEYTRREAEKYETMQRSVSSPRTSGTRGAPPGRLRGLSCTSGISSRRGLQGNQGRAQRCLTLGPSLIR